MRNLVCAFAIAAGISLIGLDAQVSPQKLDPLVMMDRTGSILNQEDVETLLAHAIARFAGFLGSIRLIAFADRVLDVPTLRIEWPASGGWQSGFAALSEVQRSRAEKNALGALKEVLGNATISAARATNIPAVLVRAGRDGHALVVTDGENQVASATKALTETPIEVILCSAKSDRSDRELEISLQRRSAIQRWAPNARIFSCSEIDAAVRSWIKAIVKSVGQASN